MALCSILGAGDGGVEDPRVVADLLAGLLVRHTRHKVVQVVLSHVALVPAHVAWQHTRVNPHVLIGYTRGVACQHNIAIG